MSGYIIRALGVLVELPQSVLERQVAGRLQYVPLAVGGRSHVGWCVDGTDSVTGADQEVC